ncbi:MAG: xylose isomerase [Oscillospiraceae bacterium]|nr:xylose isomerase [Oscillospiraceae bacterium]
MKKYNEITHIPYAPESTDPFSFRWYDPDKVIAGKKMRDHLKFAMSYWHTIDACGTDMFGGNTMDKSFGQTDPMAMYKAKADFAFELMDKLSIDYYCFHDVDIAPEGATVKESIENFKVMVDYVYDLQVKHGKKCLWVTANNFGDKKFMCGAATSCNADVYAVAAAKVRACIDAAIKLGATGYVFWGGREGYETLLNTNVELELDNLGRFLTMARDYGRKMGFKGDFYIEPKPKEPTKHQYDFDTATCMNFLRKYNLTEDFKMNIEANHATLAGHTFQHELRMATANGAFGSIDANQGDMLLGWDTDQFPTDVYNTTYCMLEVLKAGGFTNGGLNFDAKTRRPSNTYEDILLAYIAGMDAFALGLIKALQIVEDGRIDAFVADRYSSYNTGIGKRIVDGDITLEELSEYACGLGEITVESGRQEYLETIVNRVLFG